MRVTVPTRSDGSPIITHHSPNTLVSRPVQLGEDGRYYINVSKDQFVSLLQGRDGVLWQRANPRN